MFGNNKLKCTILRALLGPYYFTVLSTVYSCNYVLYIIFDLKNNYVFGYSVKLFCIFIKKSNFFYLIFGYLVIWCWSRPNWSRLLEFYTTVLSFFQSENAGFGYIFIYISELLRKRLPHTTNGLSPYMNGPHGTLILVILYSSWTFFQYKFLAVIDFKAKCSMCSITSSWGDKESEREVRSITVPQRLHKAAAGKHSLIT